MTPTAKLMAKLLLKMAEERAREHTWVMRAIETAHKVDQKQMEK